MGTDSYLIKDVIRYGLRNTAKTLEKNNPLNKGSTLNERTKICRKKRKRLMKSESYCRGKTPIEEGYSGKNPLQRFPFSLWQKAGIKEPNTSLGS